MGWLWTSKPTEASAASQVTAQDGRAQMDEPPSIPVNEPIKQTLSREEQAEQDLMELLKEFQADADSQRGERIRSRESGVLKHTTPLPDDISPDSLYPSTIHCQSAFDYAMFCQSFGGQFVNVYRYGSFRSCSPLWSDFWLCMRTRKWDEKDKARAIKDHYRKKAVKYKTGPSSEDIWEVRNEPVKDAFQDSLEELEDQIAKWKLANPDVEDPWDKNSGTTFKTPRPV